MWTCRAALGVAVAVVAGVATTACTIRRPYEHDVEPWGPALTHPPSAVFDLPEEETRARLAAAFDMGAHHPLTERWHTYRGAGDDGVIQIHGSTGQHAWASPLFHGDDDTPLRMIQRFELVVAEADDGRTRVTVRTPRSQVVSGRTSGALSLFGPARVLADVPSSGVEEALILAHCADRLGAERRPLPAAPENARRALLEAAVHSSDPHRAAAQRTLAALDEPGVIEHVARVAANPHEGSFWALASLGEMRHPAAAAPIFEALHGESLGKRRAALRALSGARDLPPDVVATLLAMTTQPESQIRLLALRRLVDAASDETVVPALLGALDDEHLKVRRVAAVGALVRGADPGRPTAVLERDWDNTDIWGSDDALHLLIDAPSLARGAAVLPFLERTAANCSRDDQDPRPYWLHRAALLRLRRESRATSLPTSLR